MAPNTYILGGGAKDWMKTATSSIRRCPRGPEVTRLRAPALEQPPRRLDHGLVQLLVSSRADVILAAVTSILHPVPGPFDDRRHSHRRLLGQSGVPARQKLAHYQSTLSTKMWMIPPHVSPTPKASSSEMP